MVASVRLPLLAPHRPLLDRLRGHHINMVRGRVTRRTDTSTVSHRWMGHYTYRGGSDLYSSGVPWNGGEVEARSDVVPLRRDCSTFHPAADASPAAGCVFSPLEGHTARGKPHDSSSQGLRRAIRRGGIRGARVADGGPAHSLKSHGGE
ncbi:hypothetical protein CSOJ01_00774 [Colletotrichum sojae]|uniref:Uncharacterized protein n=1 Tax=Colletotrichum sojae TaxID=2175907 RepID=A0A8H6N5M4_9PEZI|nr:hypothetical protein CSOJ01_00774 [Colletotrichum sojae]